MNFFGKLQKQYDQLWKYIIRPTRSPYSEESLGPSVFTIKGNQYHRKDFQLSNKRGYDFSCSLWLPVQLQHFPCVIYLHGNSSNRIQGTQYLRRLLINKIALCTFDFSGSGNAQGQYVTLGHYQQQDLSEVINYLQNYPQINNIALWGRSMGAVTALLYLSEHKGIKSVVLDSPFKSFKALVEDMAQKTTKVPKIVLNGAIKIISRTIKQKAQFSIYDLDPLKKAAPFLIIPAFFIVGVEDQIIPIDHTKDLFETYGGDDKVIKMVKGGHNANRPSESIKEIIKFLLARFNEKQLKMDINEIVKKEEKALQPISSPAEVQKIQQSIKNGQFSWSNLFSIFNNSKVQKQQKQQPKQEKKEKKEKEKKQIKQFKQQKINPSKEMSKILAQSQLQDSMRQYTYCYI